MRTSFFPKKSWFTFASAAVLALSLVSCEGLDDWSDLTEVGNLFNDDSDNTKNPDFIRYSLPGMSATPAVEYLHDGQNYSKFFLSHIQKACDYTKVPFRSVAVSSFTAPAATTRVLVVHDTRKLSNAQIDKLLEFVSQGGTLFIPFALEDHRMAYLYGFKPDAEFDTDAKSNGIRFTTPIFPSMKGLTVYENVPSFGFARQNFSNKVKVLATAANNPNFPAIVENKIGEGKVLLYNASTFMTKQDRGFVFAGILKGLEGVPYPVANVATIFLDDFPSPLYNIKAEPIASEMNLNMTDFVTKVWWPDMKNVADEFGLKYSAMCAFDYKNKTIPPFVFDQWNSTKMKTKDRVEPTSDWLMRDVAKHGHELSLHGYNHVEFTVKDWKNQEFIPMALKSVQKKWEAGDFGALPVTYVPPSNIIDPKGVVQLKKGMPSIRYMCSLYLGELKDGGEREFDYDPFQKDLFDYPRISSGFYMNSGEKYILHSQYLMTGVWNHFVHPDDVYQIPATANASAGDFDLRNKLSYGWRKTKGKDKAMLGEFRAYLAEMRKAYPQLRYAEGGVGGKKTIAWRAARFSHKTGNGLYTVDELGTDKGEQYWFMYVSPQNAPRIDAQLKGQGLKVSKSPMLDGYLYSVYSKTPVVKSIDILYKTPPQKAKAIQTMLAIKADFAGYKLLAEKYRKGLMWEDDSEKKLAAEIAALRKRMMSEARIDSVTWNKYAKYMSWEDRGNEVWKMLEDHVAKHPLPENTLYSQELDRVIGYPNDDVKERWLWAQIQLRPDDKALVKDYLASFYNDGNEVKIQQMLKALYRLDPTVENYTNYLKHLLQYDQPEALQELADKKATDAYGSEVATNVTWLYADNNDARKAYEWSAFAKDVDFVSRMNWLIELKDYKLLESDYNSYIAQNPQDYKAKALMAEVLHEQGRFKESWALANSLPEVEEKEGLRKTLNIDVVSENRDTQEYLIANEVELFYPNVLKELQRKQRLERGNFVDLDSYVETNQKDPALFRNRASYNVYDKHGNIHSGALTYSQYYKLELLPGYPNNFDNALKGIEYKFTRKEDPEVEGKIQYWSRARFEIDDRNKGYFQFGGGLSLGKNRKFHSAEINVAPVAMASGMNMGIYQAKLDLFEEFYLFNRIHTSIAFEGSYYTDGLIGLDTITAQPPISEERPNPEARTRVNQISPTQFVFADYDDAIEGALTLRMAWDNGAEKRSKFIPYLEGQYALGSRNLTVGFPYWMIDERLYGGGGLGWAYNAKNFNSKLEAGYFLDDYSGNFQRYSGRVEYQLLDFTAISLNFEFFAQDKYYSNSLQLGIKHNFKKRVKRK